MVGTTLFYLYKTSTYYTCEGAEIVPSSQEVRVDCCIAAIHPEIAQTVVFTGKSRPYLLRPISQPPVGVRNFGASPDHRRLWNPGVPERLIGRFDDSSVTLILPLN